MNQEYEVVLYSPLGPRKGKLFLSCSGTHVTGTLSLLGHQNPVQGEQSQTGTICLFHNIQTQVSNFSCKTTLILDGDQLSGLTLMDQEPIHWHGTREKSKASL